MLFRRIAPALALAAIGFAACGTPPRLTADKYYTEGKAAFTDKNYEGAIRNYKDLLDQYPFDPHAEEAELAIAESHYKKGQYAEAIAAFNDFQRMHPMSPALAKVYYLLGRSFDKQMTTIDRDQQAADNAQGWYRVVLDRYPESEYAPRARRRMARCRESMAEHERYVARFYFKQNNVRAGENRVKGLLEKFSDTVAATAALEDLAAAYERRGDEPAAAKVRAAVKERTDIYASMPETGPGSRAAGAVPAVRTPISDALLADLVASYGPSESSSTVVAAPALVDPVAAPKLPTGGADPGAYQPIGRGTGTGAGGGGAGMGRY
ncbi:MAG: outer membrane protein assembly factor BamD [Myxococcales bacterium]|jgi:outer membrane protein assembly factor BamD|nr:outer membrane protein assembly factor BamD [Myxococcales bacterium]